MSPDEIVLWLQGASGFTLQRNSGTLGDSLILTLRLPRHKMDALISTICAGAVVESPQP